MKGFSGLAACIAIFLLSGCKDNAPIITPKPIEEPPTGLAALPVDSGGVHTRVPLGSTSSPYGYYIYTPSAYTSSGPKFPLVIFLHGSEEIGNSQENPAELDKILIYGPPKLITQGTWHPKYPMLVASPQCHDSWWDWQKVHDFIAYVRSQYQVDTTRIYLTGLSMGGYGTWDQLISFGKDSYLAAAVPIAGSGTVTTLFAQRAAQVPIWAFHGENDPTVPDDYDLAMHAAVNAENPKIPAKLTLYPNTGHDCWTITYNGTGAGKEDPAYDPFNMDVFTWMLQFQKQ